MKDLTQTVTRFDVRETEDGDEIRLFNGRKKLFAFGVDDIAREDYADTLPDFIAAKPRSVDDVENFLTTEAGEDGDGEGEEGGGSIVPQKYRERYGVTQRCGDDIAETLSGYVTEPRKKADGKDDIDGGLNREKLREVANANGLSARLDDYENRELNGGLLRMNISNILRGMNRRGEKVVIGQKVFPAREVEKPKRQRKAKTAPAKK